MTCHHGLLCVHVWVQVLLCQLEEGLEEATARELEPPELVELCEVVAEVSAIWELCESCLTRRRSESAS